MPLPGNAPNSVLSRVIFRVIPTVLALSTGLFYSHAGWKRDSREGKVVCDRLHELIRRLGE